MKQVIQRLVTLLPKRSPVATHQPARSVLILMTVAFGMNLSISKASSLKYVDTGSFIINMGSASPTPSNSLMPYGLVRDLIVNYRVPVLWAIEPNKAKDGIDFTHNGVTYRGGTFIVESVYLDSAVSSVIASWQSQGVTGDYSVSPIYVPVDQTLTSFPKVMIDTTSSLQAILVAYFNNAGIPPSAYDFGIPSGLTSCHDVWANPHGDPAWSTHSYLKDFITVQKGWIWAQCHAVSMMENCRSATPPYQQLNFLTTSGMKCWGSNKCGAHITESHPKVGSGPYTYSYPTDPYMQFLGTMHTACTAGSEQWFQPLSTGSWRSTTKVGVRNGHGSNPNQGTVLAYGPAYGDSTNGWVMYEGGHSLDSGGNSLADKVAGQRAFLNFLFRAGVEKRLNITASMTGLLASGQTTPAIANVTFGQPPYTYEWTSRLDAQFSSYTTDSTVYTAPFVTSYTTDVVRVKVTDQCGRVNFVTLLVNIGPSNTLPVSLLSFKGESKKNNIHLKWETGSEINSDYFTISSSPDGINFEMIGVVKAKGNSSNVSKYSFIDNNPYESQTFYSLSQTDIDGQTEKFPPIFVKLKKKENDGITVYPNPVDKKANLLIQSDSDMGVLVQVFSSMGVKIYEKQIDVGKGTNNVLVDMDKHEQGTYYLTVYTSTGERMSKKLIKK